MHLRLVLDVTYVPGTIAEKEATTLLSQVAFHAASNGLLTGETPGEVETWEHHVEFVLEESDDAHPRSSTSR